MTARRQFWRSAASAVCFILTSTMAEISSGAKRRVSPLKTTSSMGESPSGAKTLKGNFFMSSTTAGSLMLRPMRRLAS